jgi:hypothetical protein
MYLISCSTFMCTVSASVLSIVAVIDGQHRVRSDRISEQRATTLSFQSLRSLFSRQSRLAQWFRYEPVNGNAVEHRGGPNITYGAVNDREAREVKIGEKEAPGTTG